MKEENRLLQPRWEQNQKGQQMETNEREGTKMEKKVGGGREIDKYRKGVFAARYSTRHV